jgi:hypothetical protein
MSCTKDAEGVNGNPLTIKDCFFVSCAKLKAVVKHTKALYLAAFLSYSTKPDTTFVTEGIRHDALLLF